MIIIFLYFKVLTSYETGVPYCLDPHTLETLGPDNLNGHLQLGCFAAHFRIDSERKVNWFLVVEN